MTDPILSLKDVTLTLQGNAGPVEILHGITLAVGAGETLGLVGPSGSGKSSLLMLMVPQITQGITSVSLSIGGAAIVGAVGGVSLAKMKAAGGKAAGYGLDTLKGGGAVRDVHNMYGNATEMLKRMRGIA